MSKLKPRRSRRVEPPKDSDYDHEINLLDHSSTASGRPSLETEATPQTSAAGPSIDTASSPDQRHRTLNRSIPTNDQANGLRKPSDDGRAQELGLPAVEVEQATPIDDNTNETTPKKTQKPRHTTPESAIDILYENQRGGFLCGIPLFASKALGNLDSPPWTNFAHKPSPTDITTAQPPDPSWEWAWPEWRINHDDGVDEDGWEYSFAFHKKLSWHGPKWWNSFVRRRAWIRKRVKTDQGYVREDPSMLNAEYFAVRPASVASQRSPSRAGSRRGSRVSAANSQVSDVEELEPPDIEDAISLLWALRASRIDREKIEAIDNYLEHASDDFATLEREMHEIMSLFVFQASRRVLHSRLAQIHDQTLNSIDEGGSSEQLKRKAQHLTAAIKHADEEVRRLEYWSDIKEMVVEGETKGAMDHSQGWDESWRGLDTSGPTEPAAPGESPLERGNG